MRALIGLAPGLAESAFALVEATPRAHGEARRYWNGLHFEWHQPLVEDFRCVEARTVESRLAVPQLANVLRALRKRKANGRTLDVSVVIDRAEIGNQKLQALWHACVAATNVSPTVVDVDAGERAQDGHRIAVINPASYVPPARYNVVTARDVAGAVEHAQSQSRATISNRAREAATLIQEIVGFSGQIDRRLARAFALALWYGESSGADSMEVGMPVMDDEERKMLESAMEEMREDE